MQRDQLLADRYRLIERLGAGGMSTVWRAHDEVLERDVAVKVLTATDPGARWRIRAEAKAAARLSHPNLTNVYDFGESPGGGEPVPFVVMELLTGTTLARRLDSGPLPPAEALRVCADVAAGIATAHAQNLVHRDVKPENVMLTPTGAKLLDFGIAAGVGAPEIDGEGRILGTPTYAAPERLDGGKVSPALDVYALGLLLHHTLVGQLPPRRTRTDEPGPLPELDGVPADVDRLHRRCLARDPADRPKAGEVAAVLAAALVRAPAANAVTASAAEAARVSAAEAARASAAELARASGRSGDRAPEEPAMARPHDPVAPPAGRVRGPLPAPPGPGRSGPTRRAGTRLLVTAAAAVLGAVAVAGTLGSPTARRPGPTEEPPASRGTGGRSSVALPVPVDPLEPSTSVDAPTAPTTTVASAAPTVSAGRTPPVGPTPTGGTTGAPSTGDSTEIGAHGGTVRVRCDGKLAEVLAVVPAAGYRLGAYDPGPARQVRVELVSVDRHSVVTVRCANGRPVARVREDPPAGPGAVRGADRFVGRPAGYGRPG